MAKKYLIPFSAPLVILLTCNTSFYAEDLLSIYKKAAEQDPILKQAESNYLATKQNCPIALADLLPNLILKAGISHNKALNFTSAPTTLEPNGVKNPSVRQSYFEFNAGQSLFEWDKISRLLQSEIEVHKAIHDLETAKQDLLTRVTKAYFNVLEAEDNYEYNLTERNAVKKLYDQAKEKFNVGLIAIGDVEEAKARFDVKSSDEIKAKNDVADRYEELNAIIGEKINHLSILTPNFKPSNPKPANIEDWVKMALRRNHSLASEELAIQIQDKNVDIAFADHLPKVRANAHYLGRESSRSLFVDQISATKGYISSYGYSLDGTWELFASGGTQAKIDREKYNTAAQTFKTEKTKRNIISETRQAFRNILTSLSQTKALEQAQKSSLIALDATKAGYELGTRASIDVLDRLTDVYDQQRKLAQARYNYINNIINLKYQAGILTNNDLDIINNWLINKDTKIKNNTKSIETKTPKESIAKKIKAIDSKNSKNNIKATDKSEKKIYTPDPLKAELEAEKTLQDNPYKNQDKKPSLQTDTTDKIEPEIKKPKIKDTNNQSNNKSNIKPINPINPINPIEKTIENFESPNKTINNNNNNNTKTSSLDVRQQQLEELEEKLKNIIAEYKKINQ